MMPAQQDVKDAQRSKEIAEMAIVAIVTNLGVSYNEASGILLTEMARNLTPAEIKKALAMK